MITRKPPRYPSRRPHVLAAALARLETDDWARLQGEPELEADLAAFHGPDPADRAPIPWFVVSGTAALEAMLLGHGIGPGDEVLTTPVTWAATTSAILAVGAVPVFADVLPDSGLLDPASVEERITPRTRAILAVHLYGQACDAAALRAIADRRGLLFFEDGSQAHGARFNGRLVGDFGHGAAFSCMGLKLLAGTEGGYALFRDPAAAEAAYLYGKHPRGLAPDRAEALGAAGLLDALQLGWRPCTVSAALVQAALPHLKSEVAARRRNAAVLRRHLERVPHVRLPDELPGAEGCYHLLSFLYDEARTGVPRAEFIRRFNLLGGGAFNYIPIPIHRLTRLNPHDYQGPRVFWHEQIRRAGLDYRQVSCPHAEARCAKTFETGFNWTVDDPEAMRQIAEALARAARPSAP